MKKTKKKKLTFDAAGGLGSLQDVFRTAGFSTSETGASADVPVRDDTENAPAQPSMDAIRFRKERKGRGGKTVTVIEGFGVPLDRLAALVKKMKKALGVGAAVEGDNIVLQGDVAERARQWLDTYLESS